MIRLALTIGMCFFICYTNYQSLAQNPPASESRAAVTIGDYKISKEEVFDLFLKRYKNEAYEVMQELVIRWIIRQETKAEKIQIEKSLIQQKTEEEVTKAKADIQQKMQQTWEEYLRTEELTEKEFWDERYARWKYRIALERLVRLAEYRETRLEARHIMVKTKEKAEEILSKLRQQADFAALARQESVASTNKEGGLLPILFRGDIHTSLETTFFSLQPKEISGVVQSPWGFHILQVLNIFSGKPDFVWTQGEQEILQSLAKTPISARDIQRWLKKMEAKYKIEQTWAKKGG